MLSTKLFSAVASLLFLSGIPCNAYDYGSEAACPHHYEPLNELTKLSKIGENLEKDLPFVIRKEFTGDWANWKVNSDALIKALDQENPPLASNLFVASKYPQLVLEKLDVHESGRKKKSDTTVRMDTNPAKVYEEYKTRENSVMSHLLGETKYLEQVEKELQFNFPTELSDEPMMQCFKNAGMFEQVSRMPGYVFKNTDQSTYEADGREIFLRQAFWKNIIIGHPGTGSQMQRYHIRSHRKIVSLKGQTTVVLCSPANTKSLYMNPDIDFSPVDGLDPDFMLFPKFRYSKCFFGVLEPGDVLVHSNTWPTQFKFIGDKDGVIMSEGFLTKRLAFAFRNVAKKLMLPPKFREYIVKCTSAEVLGRSAGGIFGRFF
jgi:hypothetical protein